MKKLSVLTLAFVLLFVFALTGLTEDSDSTSLEVSTTVEQPIEIREGSVDHIDFGTVYPEKSTPGERSVTWEVEGEEGAEYEAFVEGSETVGLTTEVGGMEETAFQIILSVSNVDILTDGLDEFTITATPDESKVGEVPTGEYDASVTITVAYTD